jgi:hypothetical protein
MRRLLRVIGDWLTIPRRDKKKKRNSWSVGVTYPEGFMSPTTWVGYEAHETSKESVLAVRRVRYYENGPDYKGPFFRLTPESWGFISARMEAIQRSRLAIGKGYNLAELTVRPKKADGARVMNVYSKTAPSPSSGAKRCTNSWKEKARIDWDAFPVEVKKWILSDPVFTGHASDARGESENLLLVGGVELAKQRASSVGSMSTEGNYGQATVVLEAKNVELNATFTISAVNTGWGSSIGGYLRIGDAHLSTELDLDDIIVQIQAMKMA